MSNLDSYLDDYDTFTDLFDPMNQDRQARRKRKSKARHQPKKSESEIIAEIADTTGLETGELQMTYNPSLHEAGWLSDSLRTFFSQSLIVDVLALVKGGKEASVYRCEAHESTNVEYLAAKVYRPRQFRSLSNDSMYREGRDTLGVDGKSVQDHDQRAVRAVEKGSKYGKLLAHTSWLMHEYKTLERLYKLGASVPKPFASGENALLMSYHGDAYGAAHTLIEVRLERSKARAAFDAVLHNIDLMLANEMIHGDLSAYNILYWDGDITLIDFPQVVNPYQNTHARDIFNRDVMRICEYFDRYDITSDADGIAESLWAKHIHMATAEEMQADLSRYIESEEDDAEFDDED